MGNREEKKIIQQLKDGEESAYRYLFDTHYVPLCHVALTFLKDKFLAESVVGDVIFNLWEKRENINIQTSLRAYLVRSVRNRCINYLNQEYVVRESVFDLTDEELGKDGDEMYYQEYPLAILIEKELEKEITQAIHELSPETRTVFELSRFEGLKYTEIAAKLGISVNTVKYHIKSALAYLTGRFDKYLIYILFVVPFLC